MEGSNLLSSTTTDVVGLPQTDSPSPRSNSETNKCPNGDGPSTSHVACFRERFFGSCLLKEAPTAVLMIQVSPILQLTICKLSVWDAEMSRNPVSGPTSDVVNFLTKLYDDGYQANFLNSFRSAISSGHDQVDGMKIGKHPLLAMY